MKNSILLANTLLLILSSARLATAQPVADSTARKIDALFKKWDNYSSPGFAIGIVRNDTLIYAKGYGMADLEFEVRITPETIFHMASISKQFTAFSIILLADKGRLKLDDDIRQYLPWFPDLEEKITIRNLLNHTSGIRDQWQLLAISGTRLDDVITQDHIKKILSQQQALNFKPGDQYSYSNSGFTMLAEIVQSVTGQTLRQFTDSAIFKPLGMNHTHFHDDYTEIVKNRSYSYERKDSIHFSNSILSYSNAGATSLFTNVVDMSKWIENFYDHKVGDQRDFDLLTKKAVLNNGHELSYASGIVSNIYKGWRQFSHGGADAGYRTYITVIPDKKMGFIVFSNLDDADPGGMAYDVAKYFVEDTSKAGIVPSEKKPDSANAFIRDTMRFKKYAGNYISDDGVQFSFYLKDQKFYMKDDGESYLMALAEQDTFAVLKYPQFKFHFGQKPDNKVTTTEFGPDLVRQLEKYLPDTTESDLELQAYTGVFYCPELDCKYGIVLKDHHLWLANNKYNDTRLSLVGKDHLTDDFWWMNHLVVIRDKKNDVVGFEVNSGRIMHLRFNRIAKS
jgi:CubicO group peptidase (beta-lactamase class C family)